MPTAKRETSEPFELVRSDLRGLGLLLVPPIGLGLAAVFLVERTRVALAVAAGVAAVFVVAIVAVRVIARQNAIFADDKGLIVVTGGRATRVVDWDRLATASWHAGSLWTGWDPGGVLVTVDGQPKAIRVGTVVIVRRGIRARAGERVEAVLAAHVSPRPEEPWEDVRFPE